MGQEPSIRIKRIPSLNQSQTHYLYQETVSLQSSLSFELPLYLEACAPLLQNHLMQLPWKLNPYLSQGTDSSMTAINAAWTWIDGSTKERLESTDEGIPWQYINLDYT